MHKMIINPRYIKAVKTRAPHSASKNNDRIAHMQKKTFGHFRLHPPTN